MDDIFRVFMFLLPYAICFAAYIWVGKKAWLAKNLASKIVALLFVVAGFGYTVYKFGRSISSMMTNDNFEFVIILVMVGILFFAAIALALGEPEK